MRALLERTSGPLESRAGTLQYRDARLTTTLRSGRHRRKMHADGEAAAFCVVERDRRVVRVGDALARSTDPARCPCSCWSSPRKKRSNTRSRSSAGMPGPLSVTVSVAPVVVAIDRHVDAAAARRVAQRIVDQVRQQDREARRIAADRRGRRRAQARGRSPCRRRAPRARRSHRCASADEIAVAALLRERLGLHARERQQLLDDVRRARHAGFEVVERGLRRPACRRAAREIELQLERCERRAQLVRGVGGEAALRGQRFATAARAGR